MESKGATDIAIRNRNYNIKPAQVVDSHASDEDNDFPEFEFPVTNGASALDAWKAVAAGGGHGTQEPSGNSTWGFLQPGGVFSDESPKKMPLAVRSKNGDAVPEQNPFFPSPISEASGKNSKSQVLSPLATFKNLDVSLDLGKADGVEENSPAVPPTTTLKSSVTNSKVTSDCGAGMMPSTPTRKSLTAASRASSDSVASTPASKSLSKLQADLARTPERVKSGSLSASAASGKTASGMRSYALTTPRGREEATRPLSPAPDRRSLTSPRRLAPERSRSPVPFQTPDRMSYGVTRSLSPSPRSLTPTRASLRAPITPRSTSPVPTRNQSSNLPKEQWNGSTARSASMPNSPRYITPTRAASLKAVKTTATPNGSVAKELQYSPANAGNTTPRSDPVKKAPKEAYAKAISDDGHPTLKVRTSPPLTQPSGFNFKTDERSEKRRDFYQKLEERMRAKEEERKRLEAKAQEEKDVQLKELRKSLGYKANPVPKFYQEPPPPPVEIKKSPPTRARSPNFTAPRRRDSCMGSFSESSSSGSSPLRSRLVRSPSLESNSGSHASHSHSARLPAAPKVKQPFKPI